MLTFDEQKLVLLLREENWKDHEIEAMIDSLKKVNGKLQKSFDEWMSNRTISDESLVEDISIKKIIDKRKCHFLNALLVMDTYLDNPVLAKQHFSSPFFRI